jgi:hypothetical protein
MLDVTGDEVGLMDYIVIFFYYMLHMLLYRLAERGQFDFIPVSGKEPGTQFFLQGLNMFGKSRLRNKELVRSLCKAAVPFYRLKANQLLDLHSRERLPSIHSKFDSPFATRGTYISLVAIRPISFFRFSVILGILP